MHFLPLFSLVTKIITKQKWRESTVIAGTVHTALPRTTYLVW